MHEQQYTIFTTEEYDEWFEAETWRSRAQISDRLDKIETEGYFGNRKYLAQHDLWELKFNDGRRIYYIALRESNLLLLLGGNKNGQTKDISKAKNIRSKRRKDH